MTRPASNYWDCVICGIENNNGLICWNCERKEKDKQHAAPGSLTEKQLRFINHLIYKTDDRTVREIILEIMPDFDGDLDFLSMNQAGALIAKLLAQQEGNDTPSPTDDTSPV